MISVKKRKAVVYFCVFNMTSLTLTFSLWFFFSVCLVRKLFKELHKIPEMWFMYFDFCLTDSFSLFPEYRLYARQSLKYKRYHVNKA